MHERPLECMCMLINLQPWLVRGDQTRSGDLCFCESNYRNPVCTNVRVPRDPVLLWPAQAINLGRVTFVHFHNKENPRMALPPSLLTWACKSIETQQTGRCYVIKDGGLKVNVMGEDGRIQRKPYVQRGRRVGCIGLVCTITKIR